MEYSPLNTWYSEQIHLFVRFQKEDLEAFSTLLQDILKASFGLLFQEGVLFGNEDVASMVLHYRLFFFRIGTTCLHHSRFYRPPRQIHDRHGLELTSVREIIHATVFRILSRAKNKSYLSYAQYITAIKQEKIKMCKIQKWGGDFRDFRDLRLFRNSAPPESTRHPPKDE